MKRRDVLRLVSNLPAEVDAEQLIADIRHLDQTGEVAWEEATKKMLDKRLKELEDSNFSIAIPSEVVIAELRQKL